MGRVMLHDDEGIHKEPYYYFYYTQPTIMMNEVILSMRVELVNNNCKTILILSNREVWLSYSNEVPHLTFSVEGN